jgi:hypothetical protein
MQFDISLSKPHLRRELEADMKEYGCLNHTLASLIAAGSWRAARQ